jgi:hypothetical protein
MQQSSRIAWSDSLFETVPRASWPPAAVVEPVPVGEVGDSTWAEFDAAQGDDEPMWRVVL